MVREWIDPIFDRTYGDVVEVQSHPELEHAKGAWNAEDLNRIEKNTAYCVEYMIEKQIYRSDPRLEIRENDNWTGDDIPTYNDISRIINNVRQITEYARENNANIQQELPVLYPSTHIDYELANQIERALDILHNQPDPPKDYFKLEIEEGLILRVIRYTGEIEEVNSNEVLLAEDEVAVIRGIPSEPDAQYKHFQFWSGDEDDLQYLKNWEAQETEYLGQYRNVKFKANFQTRIPRTLTINNGYISVTGNPRVETGPSYGTYFAGDRIMIISNVGTNGKTFYEWRGTEEGIKNIVGIVTNGLNPSTSWLQMPDCDVELDPFYVTANGNRVTVKNGTGSGIYKYGEYVFISANVPDHYGFDRWSGDTGVLDTIESSSQSFKMPDRALNFTAEYSYRYSYNDIQVTNGTIDGQFAITGAMQTSKHTLAWNAPPAGKGFQYWKIEGQGSATDTSFTVGDSNAILTAIYNNLHTCTIVNSITSEVNTYTYVTGRVYDLSHPSISGYNFSGFSSSDVSISHTSYPDRYYFTMPDKDVTITINYNKIIYRSLTIENIDNSGQSTTSTVTNGTGRRFSTNMFVGDYVFDHWEINGSNVSTSENYPASSYSYYYIYADTTVKAVYRQKVNRNLTVNNGYIISTGETSGTYLEGTAVQISKNATPEGASFTGWSSSGLYSIGSGNTPTVVIGRTDGTATANFSNVRKITVVTHSGTTTYNVIQGNSLKINANPAPNTWEWDANPTTGGWKIDAGGTGSFNNQYSAETYFYAGTTDATIRASYKEIPWFTVTVHEGYVGATEADLDNKLSTGTFLRDTKPYIRMKPAPDANKRFSYWEINKGSDNDLDSIIAETTQIRKLLNDVEVTALYYTPDPEAQYTVTVIRYNGDTTDTQVTVGGDFKVNASYPPEGMKFYRWEGDYRFLTHGRYSAENLIKMPAEDITIEEKFVPEDWTPTYHLHMTSLSECMYETKYTDSEGNTEIREQWDTEHEYEEGTRVRIHTKGISFEDEFVIWQCVDEEGNSCLEYIEKIRNEDTYVTMPDKDLYITPEITKKYTYALDIIDSAPDLEHQEYVENARAEIWFGKTSLEAERGEVKYKFKRWVTGPNSEVGVQDLKLYETGRQFNVMTAGTELEPQYISMPAKHVIVQATYDTLYKIDLTNGTIDDLGEDEEPYYEVGTEVNITADEPPENKVFVRWAGDTEYIQNKWDPTTTVTVGEHVVNLIAIYALATDRNDIGYNLTDLKESNTISSEDIELISGKVELGCLVTDINGHNYVVTAVDDITGEASLIRMTKVVKGGNVYE